MAHSVSLQFDDGEYFFGGSEVYAVSAGSAFASAFPVTRSQAKDPRFDPMKGNRPGRRIFTGPTLNPCSTKAQPNS